MIFGYAAQFRTLFCFAYMIFFMVCTEKHKSLHFHEEGFQLGISKAYVINMDNRRDRMRFMSERLMNLSIPFERFPAVNFYHGHYPIADFVVANRLHPLTKMNLTVVREEMRIKSSEFFNWGSTGCWQSHLQLYFHIHSVSANVFPGPFFVLEDDADITRSVMKYLTSDYLENVLPSDWEIFSLSHSYTKCHNILGDNTYKKTLPPDLCHFSQALKSAGYILRNHSVVSKMIHYANTVNASVIDYIWNLPYATEALIGYGIKPNPIRQRSMQSDIHKDHKKTVRPMIGATAFETTALPINNCHDLK